MACYVPYVFLGRMFNWRKVSKHRIKGSEINMIMKYENFCGSKLYLIGLLAFLFHCLALTEMDGQLIGEL